MALFDGLDDIAAIWHVDGAGETVDHLVGDALSDEAAKFSLFALIFLPETGLNRFVEVFTADPASLLDDVEEDFLRALVAAQAMLSRVADISAGYVGGSISREGDAVGDLATPA